MNPPRKNTGSNSFNEIATLRIEPRDTDPVIWRQVEVPTSVTLKVLRGIIQAVMGWLNHHLWEFTIGKQGHGLPANQDWGTESRIEASKVRLCDVLKSRKNGIDYPYGFGDSREHRITVTNIRPAESGVSYPRYIAGEWNAPPEDRGGIPRFHAMLEAVADLNHPNHAEAKEWRDEYDPRVIDELPITCALGRIANRRHTAKARLANNKQTPSATE
jgi:hypothetical protein